MVDELYFHCKTNLLLLRIHPFRTVETFLRATTLLQRFGNMVLMCASHPTLHEHVSLLHVCVFDVGNYFAFREEKARWQLLIQSRCLFVLFWVGGFWFFFQKAARAVEAIQTASPP